MPRSKSSATGPVAAAPLPAPVAVHVIDRHGVYSVAQARAALGLREHSLMREIRKKRLKVAKRCGRYYLLGAWLLRWLKGGVVTPPAPAAGSDGAHD